ncbi:uncharacterized protein K02A2.6-like [Harmonia axyridis]|uniref:uncharacterized protein K02A2.6-like n=1 Tax=Harmonia axyridis TaxID=115357 RepID=UPI001E2797C4|nr:uncharacterized protein K02A2.6-like [Harmonia axyridis]
MSQDKAHQSEIVVVSNNICQLNGFKVGDDFEIFAQYFIANAVGDDRKTAVLLTLVDENVYKTIKNLSRVSVFRKRIIFNNLRQGEESISEWFVKIKQLAAPCKFGNSVNERVKDKFVTGLRSGPILDRLCEETEDKPLPALYEIAVGKEAALKETRVVDVNKMKPYHERKKSVVHQKETKVSPKHEDKKNGPKCFACDGVDHDFAKFCLNGRLFKMEVDTGAGLSCMPFNIYLKHFNSIPLSETQVKLKTYDGTVIIPKGCLNLKVGIKGIEQNCSLMVVENGSRLLLGRDLLRKFDLDLISLFRDINLLEKKGNLVQLLERFENLFKNELGFYNGAEISLEICPNTKPIFCKPRPVPYAYREKVKEELSRLLELGVIEKVDHAEWGTPLVIALKPNSKDIRLCANYKATINKYLVDVNHPLPLIQTIFAALQGGKQFTKLDYKDAYNQLQVNEKTGLLLAWSTDLGIFKLKRLPFGTKPACAIFQSILEKVLSGISGVVVFIDDIVVTGRTKEEHLQNLEQVLSRLEKFGFMLNKQKCEFFKDSITYLGHHISVDGLTKDFDKVSGILKCSQPKNVTEVKAFCGMVNYYHKFIPNISVILKPMYELRKKNTQFKWSYECNKAFELIKKELVSDKVLTHYCLDKPLRLSCDASFYGIGACLSHVESYGPEDFIEEAVTEQQNVFEDNQGSGFEMKLLDDNDIDDPIFVSGTTSDSESCSNDSFVGACDVRPRDVFNPVSLVPYTDSDDSEDYGSTEAQRNG